MLCECVCLCAGEDTMPIAYFDTLFHYGYFTLYLIHYILFTMF